MWNSVKSFTLISKHRCTETFPGAFYYGATSKNAQRIFTDWLNNGSTYRTPQLMIHVSQSHKWDGYLCTFIYWVILVDKHFLRTVRLPNSLNLALTAHLSHSVVLYSLYNKYFTNQSVRPLFICFVLFCFLFFCFCFVFISRMNQLLGTNTFQFHHNYEKPTKSTFRMCLV